MMRFVRVSSLLRSVQRCSFRRSYSCLTKSISQGPTNPPLLTQTIPEHFASIVSKHGDRPAVISMFPPHAPPSLHSSYSSITYHSLDILSNQLAHSLRQQCNVQKGDRIAVSLGNCWEFAALHYAIFKLGAILVPLNPLFTGEQVSAALNHLEVKTMIIGAMRDRSFKPWKGSSNFGLLQSLIPDLEKEKIESEVVPTLKKVVVVENQGLHQLTEENYFPELNKLPGLVPFISLLQDGKRAKIVPDEKLRPEETINIQFTSGTTAQPKAAMLSHTGILNNGYLIADRMRLTPEDKIVCPPPLFHCFGSVLGYMATATTGAGILFPSPAFDPEASVRMALGEEWKATGLYGVSTMFVAMLDCLEGIKGLKKNERLRKGIAAGSSIPPPLMERIVKGLGLDELVICYGMTETSPVSCMTSVEDRWEKRTGSVGRAMPHTKVKIVDGGDRRKGVVKVGQRGELGTAGYLVMKGYWGSEELTKEVRVEEEDGEVWVYSGDEAVMDEEGYVEITGRIKDLIIRGGENIHPLEIESCLFGFEEVVKEVSVVGVDDHDGVYGECVVAFVVLQEGKGEDVDAIQGYVRDRLSKHLVPKYVFFVKEFPKTASGKIQKFKLREMAGKLVKELEGRS